MDYILKTCSATSRSLKATCMGALSGDKLDVLSCFLCLCLQLDQTMIGNVTIMDHN